jgi:putative ABC transport system permease protein
LLGAVVGIVLILPFNGMTTGIGNNLTFSETVFSLHLTWGVALIAVAFAMIMGLLGGFAPAWHAARQDILTSLRAYKFFVETGLARSRIASEFWFATLNR